jgi:hypothetical protein
MRRTRAIDVSSARYYRINVKAKNASELFTDNEEHQVIALALNLT